MSQEQNVLRCYACDMYQVHIVKKAKKWQCKICNEKQSIQRVYFRGSGQDCRFTAQKLNISKADSASFSTASSIDTQDMNNSNVSTSSNEFSDIQENQCAKDSSKSGYLGNSKMLESVQRNISRNHFEQHSDNKRDKSTWSKYLQSSDANNDVRSEEHGPFQNNSFEFGNKIQFHKNVDENMWSDILEELGSDSDSNVTAPRKILNTCKNNSDTKEELDDSYKPELTLCNRSSSFQNKSLHGETETKRNVSIESPSIFETNDGLDDICLDL